MGEVAVSVVDGLAHDSAACWTAAETRVSAAAAASAGRPLAGSEGRFHVVVTPEGVSASAGLFSSLSVAREAAADRGVVHSFHTISEARSFLAEPSRQLAAGGSSSAVLPSSVAAEVPGGQAPGSIQTRGFTQEKLSDDRLRMMSCCIDGKCAAKSDPSAERPTFCRGGCGRSLHMITCAQLGRGFAALGRFTCPHCRAQSVVAAGAPTPALLDRLARTMVLEMTQGAESTAGSYADYVRLAEEYVVSGGMAAAGGRLIMPHDNLEACKDFCSWLGRDKERARSLESTLRGGEAYVTKTAPMGSVNVYKHPEVKAHIKSLGVTSGVRSAPRTTATPLMLTCANSSVIPRLWPTAGPLVGTAGKAAINSYIGARWALESNVEGVGGARVGEAVGAGDCHGLMANHSSIITHPDFAGQEWSREVVEFKLEHSKTGHPRYLDLAGQTMTSGIRVADSLRAFWRACGYHIVHSTQSGAHVERPDYWVLRVTMLGMDQPTFGRLLRAIRACRHAEVVAHASSSAHYAKLRYDAQGTGSQARKYVNVAGGRAGCEAIQAMLDTLKGEKLESFASVVPGPLIRATRGFTVTHMPLQPGSTHAPMARILAESCEEANRLSPDPDLDLGERLVADWNNHSLRRMADTNARRHMRNLAFGREAVLPWEIDMLMGWNEAEMEMEMQLHYASLGLYDRIKQARITCMI